jgi:hypothetical protein
MGDPLCLTPADSVEHSVQSHTKRSYSGSVLSLLSIHYFLSYFGVFDSFFLFILCLHILSLCVVLS